MLAPQELQGYFPNLQPRHSKHKTSGSVIAGSLQKFPVRSDHAEPPSRCPHVDACSRPGSLGLLPQRAPCCEATSNLSFHFEKHRLCTTGSPSLSNHKSLLPFQGRLCRSPSRRCQRREWTWRRSATKISPLVQSAQIQGM